VVVDESGVLKAMRRMDGAPLVSIGAAHKKALTAESRPRQEWWPVARGHPRPRREAWAGARQSSTRNPITRATAITSRVAFPLCQDTSSAGFGFEVRRSVRSEPALRRAPERSSSAGPCFGRLGQAATGAKASREARYSAGVLQPSDW
jgi:hypothetical protein